MKICYYDSRTFLFYETFYAHIMLLPGIILGDSFVISLDDNWGKLVMEDIDTWSSEKILTTFKEVFELDFNALALIHDYEEKRKELKEIVPKMHNAKKITMLKHSISCLKKEFKQHLRDNINETYEFNKIQECVPFNKEGIFIMKSFDYSQKDNKEHVLIPEITKVLINRLEIMAFHESVEQMYSHVDYNEMETDMIDFIKIPLWDMPFLDELAYKQLKYTRNDLQPAMAPFKIKLQEFWDEIATIQFVDENMEQLKHLCQSKLHPFVQPIQQAINESLYISQIRNKSENNNKLTMCLGITSADKLIQYYEKVETILPYVASEIKQQVSRYMDLKAAQMFVYFKMCNNEANEPVSDTIE